VKRDRLEELSIAELVKQFEDSQLDQFNAERLSDIARQNCCVTKAMAIAKELKARSGDERSSLLKLYAHPNVQVQLMAAKLTLAIAPTAAREVIQTIADSKKYPQAMDAGMCLSALDQGIFVPK
jgi:hypothetical protein